MSDDIEQSGVEDSGVLWCSGGDWLLDETIAPEEKTEKYTDTDPNSKTYGQKLVRYLKLKPLTLREEVFVREYVKANFDKKKVAQVLEIKGTTVQGFLQRKPVQAAIRKKAVAIARAADMDQKWVMQNLREVVERCMDTDKMDAGNALRGLELIGKTMAMFADKTISEINNKVTIRIQSNVATPIIEGQVIEGQLE
jgi:hypothetical protein